MIDLRNAKIGDKLKSNLGETLTYVGYDPEDFYPHKVKYADGSSGSRVDSGHVMKNEKRRRPTDHNIVEIISK